MANILETVVFADGETANTQQATGTQTAETLMLHNRLIL